MRKIKLVEGNNWVTENWAIMCDDWQPGFEGITDNYQEAEEHLRYLEKLHPERSYYIVHHDKIK